MVKRRDRGSGSRRGSERKRRAVPSIRASESLRVSWVQPRVLQPAQISLMTERLSSWQETVTSTVSFLENETPEFS